MKIAALHYAGASILVDRRSASDIVFDIERAAVFRSVVVGAAFDVGNHQILNSDGSPPQGGSVSPVDSRIAGLTAFATAWKFRPFFPFQARSAPFAPRLLWPAER